MHASLTKVRAAQQSSEEDLSNLRAFAHGGGGGRANARAVAGGSGSDGQAATAPAAVTTAGAKQEGASAHAPAAAPMPAALSAAPAAARAASSADGCACVSLPASLASGGGHGEPTPHALSQLSARLESALAQVNARVDAVDAAMRQGAMSSSNDAAGAAAPTATYATSDGVGGGDAPQPPELPAAVLEAVEARMLPVRRAMRNKAEASDVARLEALVKSLGGSASAGIGGGDGSASVGGGGGDGSACAGSGGGGGSASAMALAELASQSKQLEGLRDAIDEVSARTEQLSSRQGAGMRHSTAELRALREATGRMQQLLEAGGVEKLASSAARKATSAPLELLAIAIATLAAREHLAFGAASDGLLPTAGDAGGDAGAGAAEGDASARRAAALFALRPLRSDVAVAGASCFEWLTGAVMDGALRPPTAASQPVTLAEASSLGTPHSGGGTSRPRSDPLGGALPSAGSPASPLRRGRNHSGVVITSYQQRTPLSRPSSAGCLGASASAPKVREPSANTRRSATGGGAYAYAASVSGALTPVVVGEAPLDARVRDIERSLAPGSVLESRLGSVEKHCRATVSSLPKDAWGKLWNAVNRLQARLQALESAARPPEVRRSCGEVLGEASCAHQHQHSRQHRPPTQYQQQQAQRPAPRAPLYGAAAPAEAYPQLFGEVPRGASGVCGESTGSGRGDALLASIPGLLDSTEGGPTRPVTVIRPSSAASVASSLRPLSASSTRDGRTAPSITPLDGGGGTGLPSDFHLGVL